MVSVIVPVYNKEKYIDGCLMSIINQTNADWECILIDDGSIDQSGSRCDFWSEKDSRIKVFHTSNHGVSSARNLGIEKAQGEYLYFLDADDWCEPYVLDVAKGSELIAGESNLCQHKSYSNDNYIIDFLRGNLLMCTGSFLVKKQIIDTYSIRYKEGCKYGEDLGFSLDILMHVNTINVCRKKFMNYRMVENSAMHTVSLHRFDAFSHLYSFIHKASLCGLYDVRTFLVQETCPDAFIVAYRDMLRYGLCICDIQHYIKEKGIYQQIITILEEDTLKIRKKLILKSILHLPHLYKLYVMLEYRVYDIRAELGLLRMRIINKTIK